jgi:tRNA threonylcarbamoyladenosine biosynthesis protein TsaE
MAARWVTRSEAETRDVGVALAERLRPCGVLLLAGELGAGKTVLAQGVAAGLGIDAREVQSPSYTLMREHRGGEGGGGAGARLLHVDLYRLEPEQAARLGLEEALAGGGVKVVEWPERLPFPVPGALRLRLRRLPDGGREIVEDGSVEDERVKD